MADETEEPEAVVVPVLSVEEEDAAGVAAGHVKMFLNGARLWVHETCVAAHEAVGWVRARV